MLTPSRLDMMFTVYISPFCIKMESQLGLKTNDDQLICELVNNLNNHF